MQELNARYSQEGFTMFKQKIKDLNSKCESALDVVFNYIPLIMFFCGIGLMLFFGALFFLSSQKKITLSSNEWQCTNHYDTRKFNGKIWYSSRECAIYERVER
jgi:hypothetical protein